MQQTAAITLSVLLLFSLEGRSQFMPSWKMNEGNNRSYMQLYGDYYFASTAITGAFASKFYSNGYLNEELKSSVTGRLKNENLAGGELSYGATAYCKPDTLFGSPQLGLIFSIKNTQHFNTLFSKDFFTIAFSGNKSYAGKTAVLAPLNVNTVSYQQFSAGLIWSGLDTNRAKIGFVVNAVKGQHLFFLTASQADFYTSPAGEYLTLTTEAVLRQSDTSSKNPGTFSGAGAGMGFFFEAPYKLKKARGIISFSVKDMGFIYWNNKSLYTERDTSFYFDGFQADNIFRLRDSIFNPSSPDSVRGEILPVMQKAFMTALPSTLAISTCTYYGKFRFIKGLRKRFNAGAKMYLYMEGNYLFSKAFDLTAHLGYGEYGGIHTGLQANFRMGDKFFFTAGSRCLQGLVFPETGTGQSIYLIFQKYF